MFYRTKQGHNLRFYNRFGVHCDIGLGLKKLVGWEKGSKKKVHNKWVPFNFSIEEQMLAAAAIDKGIDKC